MVDNLLSGAERFVRGAEKLTSIYGKWPNFHDAEVLSVLLDRTGPLLVMRISYHETHRDKVDERGFYQISNHCIVTRRFDKIRELSIDDFNHQNVLAGIVFQMMEDTLHVTVEGIFGLAARFQCSQATVEGVTRKTRDGKKETCPNTKG